MLRDTIPRGDMNKCLLTFDNELITEQGKDTANVQMDGPESFIRVTCKIMDEKWLTGAQMPESPKPTLT